MSSKSRPTQEYVCVTVAEAASQQQFTRLQAWHDRELLPAVRTQSGVHDVQSYCAFNLPQLAIVADWPHGDIAPALTLQRPDSIVLRQLAARCTYEYVQRGVAEPAESPILYSVCFVVPSEWHEEFDRWYEEEHLPMIYGSVHWSMTRRYSFPRGAVGGPTHLALHWLSDARGFDAPELKASRVTPWRRRFLEQRWFTDVEKTIYFRQRPHS